MRHTITRTITSTRATERIEVYDSPGRERLYDAAGDALEVVGMIAHGCAFALRLACAIALWTCARAATGVLALEAAAGGSKERLAMLPASEHRRLMP